MKRIFMVALATGAACAGVLLPGLAHAQVRLAPTQLVPSPRLVEYDFSEDRIYKVLVRPKNVTFLRFEPDERVIFVSCGDTSTFVLTVPKSKEFVEIKPKWDGYSTNGMIKTNKRTYLLDLESVPDGAKWYQRVSWLYTDSVTLDQTAGSDDSSGGSGKGGEIARLGQTGDPPLTLNAADLSMRYDIKGDAPFRPVHVVSDRTHTLIRMPDGLQELPALFMKVDDSKDIVLVPYVVQPPYLVVPRIMDRFVLKIGRAEVTVDKQQQAAARPSWTSNWGGN